MCCCTQVHSDNYSIAVLKREQEQGMHSYELTDCCRWGALTHKEAQQEAFFSSKAATKSLSTNSSVDRKRVKLIYFYNLNVFS